MAIEVLEEPPIYDAIIEIKVGEKSYRGNLTDAWFPWMDSIKDIFDAYFTPLGFLPPSITLEERDAIVNPPDGLHVWITTTAGVGTRELHVYRGDPTNAWYKYDMSPA